MAVRPYLSGTLHKIWGWLWRSDVFIPFSLCFVFFGGAEGMEAKRVYIYIVIYIFIYTVRIKYIIMN